MNKNIDVNFILQKRTRGKSEQRVRNGELEIILDFQDIVTYGLIKSIQIFVKRTNEVVNTPQYVGPVELQPKFQVLSQTKVITFFKILIIIRMSNNSLTPWVVF